MPTRASTARSTAGSATSSTMRPEYATFFGIHDHDGDSPSRRPRRDRRGGRVLPAHDRRAVGLRPGGADAERALDRDLAIHQARLGLYWLTEYRPGPARRTAPAHIGEALFPLFTRDFAPLAERLESIAVASRGRSAVPAETRERVTEPVRLWTEIDLQSTEHAARLPRHDPGGRRSGRRRDTVIVDRLSARGRTATKAALAEHAAWLRDDVLPRATAEWKAGPERFEEMVRLRELEADGDEILAVGEELLVGREGGARRALRRDRADGVAARRSPTSSRTITPPPSSSRWPSTAPRWIAARAFVVEHGIATPPEEDHLNVIETPTLHPPSHPVRRLLRAGEVRPDAGRDLHRHAARVAGDDARAQPRVDHQHVASTRRTPATTSSWRGDHQSEPGAPVLRRARVHRGLGLLLRADDEGGRVRRHARRAGTSSTPMPSGARPGSSSTSSSIAARSASTTPSTGWSPRPGSSVPPRWPRSSDTPRTPTYQLSYLFGRHMIEKLKADVQAREGTGFDLRRFHDTLLYGGTMPVSYARRLFERNGR